MKLDWDWHRDRPEPADTAEGPSMFTALEEQLGLKLEWRKGPLDVLVVGRAEEIPQKISRSQLVRHLFSSTVQQLE